MLERWRNGIARTVLLALAVIGPPAVAVVADATAGSAVPKRPAGAGDPALRIATEIRDLRTSHSRTYRTRNGMRVAKIFPTRVNYRDTNRRWRKIDNDLTRGKQSGFAYENTANGYGLALPHRLSNPVLIRKGGASIRFELERAEGTAVVRGNQAMYGSALRDVDVTYASEASEVKEFLTLNSRQAPRVYRFSLNVSRGVVARKNRAGGIDFSRKGRKEFSFAPPAMWEQSSGPPAVSHHVAMRLAGKAGSYRITLVPDRKWLDAPERRFPVVLDPTWTESLPNDCYISSGTAANTTFCHPDTRLNVGWNGSVASRSLIDFCVSGCVSPGTDILNAEVSLYLASRSTTAQAPVALHAATKPWNARYSGGPTWNRYNASDSLATWATPGGDFVTPAAATNPSVGGSLGWYYWFPTQLAQEWLDGVKPAYGLLLKQASENVNNVLRFISSDDPGTSTPHMVIYYEPRVGQLPRYEFDAEEPPDPVITDDNPPEDLPLRFDVNVANGNLLVREQDLLLDASGPDVDITRYWNSLENEWDNYTETESTVGNNWSLGTGRDIRLVGMRDGSQVFYGPSGYAKAFQRRSDGTYAPPPGQEASLVKNGDGTFTLTLFDDEQTLKFSSSGKLTTLTESDGAQLTFTYSGDRLTTIRDADGRNTTFTYDGNGRLWKITEPSGAVRIYGHDPDGNLDTYTDPSGRRTEMTYDAHKDLIRLKDRDGREYRFDYGSTLFGSGHRPKRITKVTNPATGTGPTTTYTYNFDNTVVTTPDGRRTTHWYDKASIVRRTESGVNPPTIELSGSLNDADGKTIDPNQSYIVYVTGRDSDGIKEMAFEIEDGSTDSEEVFCGPQYPVCMTAFFLPTEELTPGENVIRIRVTDELGNWSTRTLVVVLPQWATTSDGPPPPLETAAERKARAKVFRQDFGLRSDDAWINQMDTDIAAQTAKDDYGVPMTPTEVQDIKVREDLQDQTVVIDDYVTNNASANAAFAGMYIDQLSGGVVNVGFTHDTAQHIAAISQLFPYPTRLRGFTAARTEVSMETLSDRITDDMPQLRSEGINVRSVAVNPEINQVEVGVPTPTASIEQALRSRYGDGVRIVQSLEFRRLSHLDRFKTYRRIRAGLRIKSDASPGGCTSNFSGYRRKGRRTHYYLLTAGHCGNGLGDVWSQGGRRIGRTVRVDYGKSPTFVDGLLITSRRRRTSTSVFLPHGGRTILRVERTKREERVGELVCKSAASSGVGCGKLLRRRYSFTFEDTGFTLRQQRLANIPVLPGDSGGPIYRIRPGHNALAVGILSSVGNVITRSTYSHLSLAQSKMNILVCARGRAGCGR